MKESLNLDEYRWQNRLILLFAQSADDPMYREQLNQFTGTETEIADRDLIVFHLFREGTARIDDTLLPNEAAAALFQQYDIPIESTLLLIGKDGGTKLRQPMPVQPADIYALIDTMPMRQAEMRRD